MAAFEIKDGGPSFPRGQQRLADSSEEQIREILAAEIADNIKKGWEEVQ
jgi:hypothetical protein